MPSSVGAMRHHAAGFAMAAAAPDGVTHAVELAVSEMVTNVVIHAYVGREPGRVSVRCQGDAERITVEVADDGVGVAPRRRLARRRARPGARRRARGHARGRSRAR